MLTFQLSHGQCFLWNFSPALAFMWKLFKWLPLAHAFIWPLIWQAFLPELNTSFLRWSVCPCSGGASAFTWPKTRGGAGHRPSWLNARSHRAVRIRRRACKKRLSSLLFGYFHPCDSWMKPNQLNGKDRQGRGWRVSMHWHTIYKSRQKKQ